MYFLEFYNKGSLDSVACVPLFMVFCVWPILFCEGWKRREGELKSLWGTTSLEQTSTLRRPEVISYSCCNVFFIFVTFSKEKS